MFPANAFRLAALSILLAFAAPAFAEKRVALVIGNSAYKHAPALANPKNDAEGMAAALQRLKFEVLTGTDLDKSAMEKLLQAFAKKLDTADVALVFYAGHGLQVHGRNYLVPIDGKLDRESDLPFQAVPLDLIQGLMEQSQRTNIMILDACRDNPLARNLARTMGTRSAGIGRGLGETKAGIGTLIVYATQPGNVALDGEGANSPFTASLLKHIEAPGLEIRQVLTRVRNEVITATREKQVPWDSSSLRGDFFFAATPAPREAPPSVAPGPAEPKPPPPAQDQETVFWQSIKDSKNAADFRAYLERYPAGAFASLARIRIAEIDKPAVVTPPRPAGDVDKPIPEPAPSTKGRTSSFERGIFVKGEQYGGPYAMSASDCQAACVKDEKCAAWSWNPASVKPFLDGVCLHLASLRSRARDAKAISGAIRVAPTAAPAHPAARSVVDEIKRKAERGELTGNVCEKTNWPVHGWGTQDGRQRTLDLWLRVARELAFRWEGHCMLLGAPSQIRGMRLPSCRHWVRWHCLSSSSCQSDRGRVWRVDGTTSWLFEDGKQCE